MIYYCDGSTYKNGQVGQDSWSLVVCPDGEVLKEHIGNRTINYAELYAILMATEHAIEGETILTDSRLCYNWLRRDRVKQTKRNGHLIDLIRKIKQGMEQKELSIEWVSRDKNVAGLFIEEQPFYGPHYVAKPSFFASIFKDK